MLVFCFSYGCVLHKLLVGYFINRLAEGKMTESVHMAILSLLEFAPASVTNIRHRLFETYGVRLGLRMVHFRLKKLEEAGFVRRMKYSSRKIYAITEAGIHELASSRLALVTSTKAPSRLSPVLR